MPVEFGAALDQPRTHILISATVADVPLTRGDDFEWLVAFLEELDRLRCGARLALDESGCAECFDHALFGRVRSSAGDCGVGVSAEFGGDPLRGLGKDPTVPANDRTSRQLQFAPPRDVGRVTERTNHRDTGTLLGIG